MLDGCNVASCHGLDMKFSVRGISITVEFFLKRGHSKVVAIDLTTNLLRSIKGPSYNRVYLEYSH